MSDMGNGPTDPYGGQPGWTPAQPGQQGQQGWGAPPPGYGPPPGFGAPPGYGYAVAPPTEGKAITALVLAILSFVFCPLVLAIVALVLASQASRDINASMGRLGGAGMVTAAKVLAWINIVLSVLGTILFFAIFATAASTVHEINSDFGQYQSEYCTTGPYFTPPPGC